jgi:hypothetical protein
LPPSGGEPGLWQKHDFARFGEHVAPGRTIKAFHRMDANHELLTMGT